jgi:hypothetical protein
MAVELKVSFGVQVALHISDREQVSELRPDAEGTRLDGTVNRSKPAVGCHLLIYIGNGTDE